MNKQKLYNAIKTLNLTNEQRNELVNVISESNSGIPEVWIEDHFVSLGGNGDIYIIDHKPIVDISDPNLYTLMPDWSDPINTYTYDEIQEAIKMLKLDHPCVNYHIKKTHDGSDDVEYIDLCVNVIKFKQEGFLVIGAVIGLSLDDTTNFGIIIKPNEDMETYNISFKF